MHVKIKIILINLFACVLHLVHTFTVCVLIKWCCIIVTLIDQTLKKNIKSKKKRKVYFIQSLNFFTPKLSINKNSTSIFKRNKSCSYVIN